MKEYEVLEIIIGQQFVDQMHNGVELDYAEKVRKNWLVSAANLAGNKMRLTWLLSVGCRPIEIRWIARSSLRRSAYRTGLRSV